MIDLGNLRRWVQILQSRGQNDGQTRHSGPFSYPHPVQAQTYSNKQYVCYLGYSALSDVTYRANERRS
jgi:hypothetical protein